MKTSFLDGSLKILFLSSLIAYIVWLLPALVSSPNVTVNVFVCKFQFRNCVPPGVIENIKIFVRVVQPKRDSAACHTVAADVVCGLTNHILHTRKLTQNERKAFTQHAKVISSHQLPANACTKWVKFRTFHNWAGEHMSISEWLNGIWRNPHNITYWISHCTAECYPSCQLPTVHLHSEFLATLNPRRLL